MEGHSLGAPVMCRLFIGIREADQHGLAPRAPKKLQASVGACHHSSIPSATVSAGNPVARRKKLIVVAVRCV